MSPPRALAAGGSSSFDLGRGVLPIARAGQLVDEVGYVPQKVRYLPKLAGAGRA